MKEADKEAARQALIQHNLVFHHRHNATSPPWHFKRATLYRRQGCMINVKALRAPVKKS